jgi:DNA-binding GntR family transcriptional regulator
MLELGATAPEARMTATFDISPLEGDGDQTVDRLYATLRRYIVSGQLEPGTIVSQVKLAESFQVGRTPLREALRMLQREGLVQAEFNRRIRVSPLTTSELEQIYAHRVVLEAVALRASVPKFSAAELALLRDLQLRMETFLPHPGDRRPEWEVSHREFHRTLVIHAGARILDDIERLQDHAERYRAILGREVIAAFAPLAREHAQIVDAAHDRDKARAAQILAAHLARSGMALIAHADPSHDGVALREALLLVQSGASA